ncbi:MAG: hypothetical protein MK098_05275, partial [Marinovum sp.]|nr:hypothetical protein [Marinovum sp.]
MSDAKALGLHKIKQLQGWLAQCAEHPPSDQPLVVFAIPLIRPEATPVWDGVCQNLARTIASLRAQT